MKDTGTSIVSVLLAIIAVAIVAVLVSQSANTSNVLTSFGSSFRNMLCAALRPIGVNCGNTLTSVTSTIHF